MAAAGPSSGFGDLHDGPRTIVGVVATSQRFTVSPRTFRMLVWVVIGVFAFITVTGAAVRLTGSGLGCEDWPTCNDDRFVAEVDDVHALIEFTNRMVSGLVLIPVVATVVAAHRRDPRRRDLTRGSWGLLAVLAIEIPLGGVTVLTGLTPGIVAAHFLVSMALIAQAVWLEDRASAGGGAGRLVVVGDARRWSWAAVSLGAIVLVSGTIVTGSGPHSGDEDVGRLPFDITEVARVHSGAMWLLLLTSCVAMWRAYRNGAPERLRRRGGVLVAAIVLQAGLGYTQYAMGVPPWLVGAHIFGSVVVWIALLRFHLGFVERDPEGAVPPGATADGTPEVAAR